MHEVVNAWPTMTRPDYMLFQHTSGLSTQTLAGGLRCKSGLASLLNLQFASTQASISASCGLPKRNVLRASSIFTEYTAFFHAF
jgi:hypothetical protein